MEEQIGGNSQFGETEIGKFPQGAHYLPVQNIENKPLIDFLHEIDSITHFSHDKIPYYNEQQLCHEPEDRLLIYGKWYVGIAEALVSLFPKEKSTWDRFFELIEEFKYERGNDGKFIFFIPQRLASSDHNRWNLDTISFRDFLESKKFNAPSLLWFIDYCCRDDYGQNSSQISAFAGIHYFTARKAKAMNCNSDSLLTWPEGNAYLAQQLAKKFTKQVRLASIVKSVRKAEDDSYLVDCFNWKTNTFTIYKAKELVLAVPRHIRSYLLSSIEHREWIVPAHQPWWVVTLELKPFPDYSGASLSWDNVVYEHQTLGYIHDLNQSLKRPSGNTLLTFYKAFDQGDAKDVRKKMLHKSDNELKAEILKDLKSIYPSIEEFISYMEVRVWGHGMVSPGINYLSNSERVKQQMPMDSNIYFAHTDDVGFSLFEEAFDLGFIIANQLNDKKYVDSF
jgi:hypothetical protein